MCARGPTHRLKSRSKKKKRLIEEGDMLNDMPIIMHMSVSLPSDSPGRCCLLVLSMCAAFKSIATIFYFRELTCYYITRL